MLEFRTMSLPSVMLFVSMKMSSGESSHPIVPPRWRIRGLLSPFVMLTGSFKEPLVKKACGLRSVPGWAAAEASWGSGSGDSELGSFYGF